MLEREAAINPLIYAEIAAGYSSFELCEKALAPLLLQRLDLPWSAGFEAGQAYWRYRQRRGVKRSPLPDFYIGAHAQAANMRLLTRDVSRYQTYFPALELIYPV